MSSQPYPGNYPAEIWPKIVEWIKGNRPIDFHGFIRQSYPAKLTEPRFFLLIDIHEFSHLCRVLTSEGRITTVGDFLDFFFSQMTERIDRYEGEVLKFVGDAILSAHKDKETAIELAKKLVEFYKLHLKVQFQYTNLVAIISCPEILLKGFSGGSAYMDYSYWGTGLNSLFKAAKEAEEGRVWFLEKGTLMPC